MAPLATVAAVPLKAWDQLGSLPRGLTPLPNPFPFVLPFPLVVITLTIALIVITLVGPALVGFTTLP